MATITIYDSFQFSLDALDLHELTDGESYLMDSTVFRVAYGGGAGDEFRGSGLEYGSDGFPTDGTVTSYTKIDNGYQLQITGLSIDAEELGDAARTTSQTDDRALFIKALGGADRFTGGSMNDHIESFAGDDTVFGGAGKDTIEGGSGKDVLSGGMGVDVLTGGKDGDRFLFDAALGSGVDVIKDFGNGKDKIVLDDDIFTDVGLIGKLAKSAFTVGSKAGDESDRIIYDREAGLLLYDPDGKGGQKAVVFAEIEDGLKLSHKDFDIVA